MPETVVTPNPAQVAAATPTGQSQGTETGFTMPAKFAGKSAEDIAKAYSELESQHGKLTNEAGKYKEWDEVAKLGKPKDVVEAINWARQVNQALKEGKITYKQAQQAVAQGPGPQGGNDAPWDNENFDMLSPREQAKAIYDHQMNQGFNKTKSYIDEVAQGYGKQITDFGNMSKREQKLLFESIKAAIQNPGTDPEELLTQAAELASKSPEELLQMALQNKLSPKTQEAEIEKRVTARLAEEEQKRQNETAKQISNATGRRPTFGNRTKTRDDENRAILQTLEKQGIKLY